MTILPENRLREVFSQYGLEADTDFIQYADRYISLMLERNKVLNLTRITDTEGIIQKHLLDSVIVFRFADLKGKFVDVGTGAGFPGIPVKLYRPSLDVTLIDSLNKRIEFLKEVSSQTLDLECIHIRAEEAGRKYREQFDHAAARAVANFDVLCEYCLPLVKVGGTFLAYKGPTEEINTDAPKLFGGETVNIHEYELPDGDKRRIIEVAKISECDKKYPRRKIR